MYSSHSLTQEGVHVLLEQAGVRTSACINVSFKVESSYFNETLGLQVREQTTKVYQYRNTDLNKFFELDISKADSISVSWFHKDQYIVHLAITDGLTKVSLENFDEMPLDLTKLKGISPYPKSVKIEYY